jgi:hypothetical protein
VHATLTTDSPERLYDAPVDRVELVDVPEMRFLMIDGAGDPATEPSYRLAIAALFALVGALRTPARPLEGLWSMAAAANDLDDVFARRHEWRWTLLVAQPHEVAQSDLAAARDATRRETTLPMLDAVRLETFHEGPAAQTTHLGPIERERPAIELVERFIAAHGARPSGRHHEIYLTDPLSTSPERLRTIIRQPLEYA